MNDIEIKNATILDGLGNEPYTGNIYVKDGKIVVITHKETYEASVSLDASGKIVTPGFKKHCPCYISQFYLLKTDSGVEVHA